MCHTIDRTKYNLKKYDIVAMTRTRTIDAILYVNTTRRKEGSCDKYMA